MTKLKLISKNTEEKKKATTPKRKADEPVINTKSASQKLQVIDDYRAGIHSTKTFISSFEIPEEIQKLIATFKTPAEVALYNQHLEAFNFYQINIQRVEEILTLFKEAIAHLTGFTLLWDSYQRTEKLLNDVLNNTAHGLREDLSRVMTTHSSYLYTDLEISGKMQLEVKFITEDSTNSRKGTNKEFPGGYAVEELVHMWAGSATTHVINIRTISTALLDGMDLIKYKPKAFKEKLKGFLMEIDEEKAVTPQYSRRSTLKNTPEDLERNARFYVYPEPETTPINEKIYKNWIARIKAIKAYE
jgi:hypothetical protein